MLNQSPFQMTSRGIEVLSPAAYLQSSNWVAKESKVTKWTREENKQFENALALYDKDTPDRWFRVAIMIPGKTVSDVIKQYKELEEDVSDIEAGLIPIPGYCRSYHPPVPEYCGNSFTLDWADSQGLGGFGDFYSPGGNRGTSTRPSGQERKKGVPWTEEEHRQFLLGLKKCGKGDWRNISRNFVTSRTPTQVASHAQKYFIRQLTGGKDKRRSSIHDITTVNLSDSKSPPTETKRPPFPDHSSTALQHPTMAGMTTELIDWKPPNQGTTMVFDPTIGNSSVLPFCGVSATGLKLLEQNAHRSSLHGSQFGLYGTVLQMNSMQHQ